MENLTPAATLTALITNCAAEQVLSKAVFSKSRDNLLRFQYHIAKVCYFISSIRNILLIFNRTQTKTATGFNLQMAMKMFDTSYYSFTFRHAGAGS